MEWNPVDILLVVIVAIGAVSGWSRGFLFAALDLLTLLASLAAAFFGWRSVAGWIEAFVPSLGVWIPPLAFVAIFLLVHLVLGTLVLKGLVRLPPKVHANALNRLLGLAPGAANGAIHAVVAAVLLMTLPLGARIGGWVQDSALAPKLAQPAEWVEARLSPVFDPALQRTLQARTVAPETRASIPLRFHVTQARSRADLEAKMLDLVNAERQAAGLKPLQADPALAEVARAHSRDMLARGYFSHYSPEGRNLGNRLQQSQVRYLVAGENLALAPNLTSAHNGLMRSPGHRANILRPQFGRLGIGILDAGVHGLMVTQAFRN